MVQTPKRSNKKKRSQGHRLDVQGHEPYWNELETLDVVSPPAEADTKSSGGNQPSQATRGKSSGGNQQPQAPRGKSSGGLNPGSLCTWLQAPPEAKAIYKIEQIKAGHAIIGVIEHHTPLPGDMLRRRVPLWQLKALDVVSSLGHGDTRSSGGNEQSPATHEKSSGGNELVTVKLGKVSRVVKLLETKGDMAKILIPGEHADGCWIAAKFIEPLDKSEVWEWEETPAQAAARFQVGDRVIVFHGMPSQRSGVVVALATCNGYPNMPLVLGDDGIRRFEPPQLMKKIEPGEQLTLFPVEELNAVVEPFDEEVPCDTLTSAPAMESDSRWEQLSLVDLLSQDYANATPNALLESDALPSETASTLGWLCSPSAQSPTCPACAQPLLKLDDGCGVCGWFPPELRLPDAIPPELTPTNDNPPELRLPNVIPPELAPPSEIPPELTAPNAIPPELEQLPTSPAQSHNHSSQSKRRRSASGWVDRYTKDKTLKSGIVVTYPRVEGERDPLDVNHWYWSYKWEEKSPNAKSNNGFISRAVPLKRTQVEAVEMAIAFKWPVEKILQYIRGEL